MSPHIRRMILAPVAAASLLLGVAGTAFAGTPAATVSVFNEDGTPAGETVCGFYVEFNVLAGGETGFWSLRDSSFAVVDHGTYTVTGTDTDRKPASGAFELPNGTYRLLWDDETPIDSSRGEQQIVVQCAAPPSPEQSVAGVTSPPTKKPGGGVGNATNLPTLPNTTENVDIASAPGMLSALLVPALAGLLALVVVLTPRRGIRRR